jgi:hypothetical protein
MILELAAEVLSKQRTTILCFLPLHLLPMKTVSKKVQTKNARCGSSVYNFGYSGGRS